MARHAVADDDGICHQRVRGIHTCQQDGSQHAVLQQRDVRHQPDAYRHDEGKQPQHQRLAPVLLEVAHVHLQPGKKHDVVQPHLAEEFEAAVAHQDVEAVLADDKPRQYHADDVRNAQAVQQHGSKQYDEEYKEKYPCRVGNGQFQAKVKPVHRVQVLGF